MRDNLSIIITMLVFVILIVIFPLYNYFERQDDMSYNLVLKSTTNFVDEVINCGYIDQDMYDKFIQELAVTGNLYDVQLEAHKKVYTKDPYNLDSDIYIEQYVIDYNADIFNEETGVAKSSDIEIDNKVLKNNAYYLNVGDQIYVKLKNSSTTMAGAIFNVIVPTSSPERLTVNYGGIVKNNAWKNQDISNLFQDDIYIDILLDTKSTPGLEEKINNLPTYSFNESSKIDFIVKIINYSDSVKNQITRILKDNLKLTGFENKGELLPKTIVKISSTEWKVSYDLTEISESKLEKYFETSSYKTCKLDLEADLIQGNYYKNNTVNSDMFVIEKRSNITKNDIQIKLSITSNGIGYKINNLPAFLLNGSPRIFFTVKIENYSDSSSQISRILKENLKLTGFENGRYLLPKDVYKKSVKLWEGYYDINVINRAPQTYFGSKDLVECKLELKSGLIQGNYYKNKAVKSDKIAIIRNY